MPEYPSVTIVVPCWNEETTIKRTMDSLLAVDYPKDKLDIFLVDDGSTDNTWAVMQEFATLPQVTALHKENGGKHTAMNWGIEHSRTELVGCLDADSFVDSQSLKRLVSYFSDSETMAVSPSIIVDSPKTFMQRIQDVEYNMAVYVKKMLGLVGGIHVTPGPFSIYRKEIFSKIGMFRKAHNTEDMEIAFRMQANHMKIEQCNDAFVYTVSPDSVKKLYKQRLRWVHGFIRNVFDYRNVLFRKKYGTFALFTVPSGIISILAAVFFFGSSIFHAAQAFYNKAVEVNTIGLPHFTSLHNGIDVKWIFLNTNSTLFIMLILYLLVITAILIGTKMAEGRARISIYLIPFMITYSILAPFWLMNAMYNAVLRKGTSWR